MILALLRQRRRRRLRARPFPKEWLTLIQRHVVFFPKLSASDRTELLGHIQVFLAEKRFEGCGGFAITDEVRVTIAAQAWQNLGDKTKAREYALKARESHSKLEQRWNAESYKSYLSRPDIQRLRKQLDQLPSAA